MADKLTIFNSNYEDINISHIIRIQAWLRGVAVRRSILKLRTEYENVLSQIEKGKSQQVEWNSSQPCKPKIVHGKPVVKATKAPTCKDLPMQDQPIKIQKPTYSEPIKVQHSVEVQTSFIELNPPTLQQTKENSLQPGPVTHVLVNKAASSEASWRDRVEPFLNHDFEAADRPTEHGMNAYDKDLQLTLPTSSSESEVSLNSIEDKLTKQKESAKHSAPVPKPFTEKIVEKSNNTFTEQQSSKRSEGEKETHLENVEKTTALKPTSDSHKVQQKKDIRGRLNGSEEPRTDRSGHSSTSGRSQISGQSKEVVAQTSHSSDQGQITSRSNQSARSQQSDQGQSSQRSDHGKSSLMSINSERSQRSMESKRSQRSNEGGRSQRSNEGERSQRLNKGEKSQRSNEGDSLLGPEIENRSARSARERRSSSEGQRSSRSNKSPSSSRSGSRREVNVSTDRQKLYQNERMSPRRVTSRSPVDREPTSKYTGNSTSLTHVTSVWDSISSDRDVQADVDDHRSLPDDPSALLEVRRSVAMELLWVQQAIDSRKNYLRLKGSI